MALSPWLSRIANLIFLRDRVREARARLTPAGEARVRAANQARLLVEIARRVAEPVEALPVGATPAVEMGLCADAAHWALVALGPAPDEQPRAGEEPAPSVLGNPWERAPAEVVTRAAGGDPDVLATVRRGLGDRPVGGDLSTSQKDAIAARKFVEALVWELDAPERRIEHLLVQRWLRTGAAVIVLLVAVFGIRAALIGPNLVAGRPFRTSSTYEPCAHKGMCSDLMFHTLPEDNPWVEFDLGSIKTIHRVELTNRSDCCSERIAGVVVELSTDQKNWTEIARNNSVFAKWTPTFPPRSTRYVRMRIPHNTVLHLDDVAVR